MVGRGEERISLSYEILQVFKLLFCRPLGVVSMERIESSSVFAVFSMSEGHDVLSCALICVDVKVSTFVCEFVGST